MTTTLDGLRARFARALEAAGGTGAADAIFYELVVRYAEGHRRYHTLEHVDACLGWLDWFSSAAEHAEEVELALWFHDAVYDPSAGDNELRSAEVARAHLTALGVPTASIDRIAGYVEATREHVASGGDAALVLDVDLSILGAPRGVYDRFEEQVRAEYAHVPEAAFVAGRRRVLEHFLEMPAIYQLPDLRAELEARAQCNLTRRVEELAAAR